jgi:hypothetical protein
MGFEKRILNTISPVLENGNHAEFYNGTLFLEDVSDEVGKRVFNRLVKSLGEDSFQFNIYRNGFVIDFV